MIDTPSRQQQQPYLVTSRQFPVDNGAILQPELVKSYIDIAQAVNVRTIGIFESTQIVTGERWFSVSATDANAKRQSYRQVYPFEAIAAGATLVIPHGITGITSGTRIYGTCVTDVPDFRPIPYASNTANNNIELKVDNTNITIINGSSSPNITSGIIILEYLLN